MELRQRPHRALNHSDCEGDLSPEECRQVAPRLRELVKSWPDDEESERGWDKRAALELAGDMDACADNAEPLIFC